MKKQSMQSRFLITMISAMLACAIFIGGLSIYEVDNFVQLHTEEIINVTCANEATQINNIFSDMEKSVHIVESYLLDLIDSIEDVKEPDKRGEIINMAEKMFADVAKHAQGSVAYYLRFDPEISDQKSGLFYSMTNGGKEYRAIEMTDLSLYEKDDTEHVGWYWQPYEAGEPVWMAPYYNQNTDILMISYVVPLILDNQFVGIVGMDFDYTALTDRVHEIRIYEHGFAHLEYEGAVIHRHEEDEPEHAFDDSGEYMEVSEELVNGMTLVLSANNDDIRQIRYDIELKILFMVLVLVAFFSAVMVFVVGKIVFPLKKLTEASAKLANGDYDVEIVHSETYEIKLLSTAFENMAVNLREHEKKQHLLAYRDSMTGLRNTTSYKAWVAGFDKEVNDKKEDFGVAVFDVNG